MGYKIIFTKFLNQIEIASQVSQYYWFLRNREKENKSFTFSKANTIAIFSDPRGGSTWLSELMQQIPNSALAFEPLLKGTLGEVEKLNFIPNQPIPENAEWTEANDLFLRLFKREILSPRLYRFNDLKKIPNADTFIFKFCWANMMMPWIVKNFDISAILFVRHPCAVISSQLKYGAWDYLKKMPVSLNFSDSDFKFKEVYEPYSSIFSRIKTPEEYLAAVWCTLKLFTLMHPENNRKWITVSYEKLYLDPESELNRIFGRLSLPMPDGIHKSIYAPSRTTIKSSLKDIQNKNKISSWKKDLTKGQIKRIFEIIEAFGIKGYSESVEPDYKFLYQK